MKGVIKAIQFFVAILFILSGLVKANDPLGLSYKMQEFFEVWNTSLGAKSLLASFFSYWHQHALVLSIVMITLEIITGVALLIAWKKRVVLNVLLLLIVFFTFLTAYAYGSGKFKNCGCFGDCLPITPLTSLVKDIALLVMIGFLLLQQRYITPLVNRKASAVILVGSFLASLVLQWYVLNYLPLADCLPFKKGNTIAEQMKIPANAIRDSFAMQFIYEKEGKRYEFAPEELPADLNTYTFKDRIQKLIRKGNAEPPIKGFTLTGLSGTDSTTAILNTSKCVLIIGESLSANLNLTALKKIQQTALQKAIPIYIITPDLATVNKHLQQSGITNIPLFSCDNTAVRTAARTDPTIYVLMKGVITEKRSYRQIDEVIDHL